MKDIINFAIVGCGRIAPKHINSIKEIDGANLIAVCDIKEEKAKKFAEENNCKFYIDYKEMLKNNNDIDVVNICTPSGSHYEITVAAAKAKKNVVTEKPMAMNLKQADEMIKVCKDKGVRLFVVKQNRFNPPMIKLKQAVDQGRFGKIFLGNVTVRWHRPQSYYDQDDWRGTLARDGGVLMNQASHHIDLLQWIMGPAKSVIAKTATMTHDIEAEDTGVAIIKFKNGGIGVIEATTCVYPKNLEGSISIFGKKGSVKVGGIAVNEMITWDFEDFNNDDALISSSSTNPSNVYGFGHIEFIKNVVGSLKNSKHAFIEGEEGRKSLELIEAIYKASETGKEVILD
jgi:UDP-N-acetyl-2-amino-2-deoxyglucuronate dehydrogenase